MATIFTSQTPVQLDEADTSTGTLGTAFFADVAGTVTAIRYYKGSTLFDGLTITVGLYDAGGTLLGSASRTQLAGDPIGWIDVPLTAVPIIATAIYIAAYLYPGTSHYVDTANFFTTPVDYPPLHAPADDPAGQRQGIFHQPSPTITFPTSTFARTNYFTDVQFTPGGTPPVPSTPVRRGSLLDGKTMARMILAAGGEYDIVSPAEHKEAMTGLERKFDTLIRDWTRGLKVMRIPANSGVPVAGNLLVSLQGPDLGFAWVVQRISCIGIATADLAGASVGLYRSSDGGAYPRNYIDAVPPNSGAFFGSKSFWLMPGESLAISATGLATTATAVTFNGEVIEAPAEMIGKLL